MFVCVCVLRVHVRVPLAKHKSMREALREKGIEMPYQDPAMKYMANEFAGANSMYINNYADVGTPPLRPPHSPTPIPFHSFFSLGLSFSCTMLLSVSSV